jgi:proline dehydrogenase
LKVNDEIRFSNALKSIARDQGLKSYIQLSEDLYPIFMKGAKRFVAGETRREGLERVMSLSNEGYEVSLEYLGENTSKEEECILAKNEFRDIINDLGAAELKATVSFDLSHIGMMVSEELDCVI